MRHLEIKKCLVLLYYHNAHWQSSKLSLLPSSSHLKLFKNSHLLLCDFTSQLVQASPTLHKRYQRQLLLKVMKCPCRSGVRCLHFTLEPSTPIYWCEGSMQRCNFRFAGRDLAVRLLSQGAQPVESKAAMQTPHAWDQAQLLHIWELPGSRWETGVRDQPWAHAVLSQPSLDIWSRRRSSCMPVTAWLELAKLTEMEGFPAQTVWRFALCSLSWF